ncbi:hypothetical protein HRbin19_01686 [bacterium HR19]|nr:hypothetical protein HRbin19_01686 [bacterium HR19]
MKSKIKKEKIGKFIMSHPKNLTKNDIEFSEGMQEYFKNSLGTVMDKLRNFPKYVPRQSLALFLAKHEIFKKILNVHGHIIEAGVFLGGGLMTWAQLSAIYEPYNHTRRIIGFDTFSGFPDISEKDIGSADYPQRKKGGLSVKGIEEDLKECIRLYDLNRPLGHIPRIEIIKGDACKTIPEYVDKNKHLVVALLYLDFDLYEPTKVALEHFLPRMPKGSVIGFDELNQPYWPGETLAVLEEIGIRNLKIQRFEFCPQISFAVLE